MDYALQLILRQIHQELVCFIDGKEIKFSDGDSALNALQKEHKHYSPVAISAQNNTVVLEIRDITEEIRKSNEEFIAEHKKKFGYEPSFF